MCEGGARSNVNQVSRKNVAFGFTDKSSSILREERLYFAIARSTQRHRRHRLLATSPSGVTRRG